MTGEKIPVAEAGRGRDFHGRKKSWSGRRRVRALIGKERRQRIERRGGAGHVALGGPLHV